MPRRTPHSHTHSKQIPPLTWVMLALSLVLGIVFFVQTGTFYPQLLVKAESGLESLYINQSRSNQLECDQVLQKLEQTVKAKCPRCTIEAKQCLNKLKPTQQQYFTPTPLTIPIGYFSDGVIAFNSANAGLAQGSCEAVVAEENQTNPGYTARCFPAESTRLFFKPVSGWIDIEHLGYALLALILAQFFSQFACFLIIRYEHLHSNFSHDFQHSGPQKFHVIPTPRIGGLGLMIGLLVSAVLLLSVPNRFADQNFGYLLLASMPAFLGGLTEDVTKKVGVIPRLLLTMISGLFGSWLLGATLPRLDIPGVDQLMQWAPFAIIFTMVAVAGVANAINIIDGYNGLAAGFGIIISAGLAFVAAQIGDRFVAYACFAMAGSLIGFLVWNWPGGKIFLGDGGAYLLGFWLAELSVLLLVRNPQVSPWFPLALIIYPVFETLYSVYRRKIKGKSSPGLPDAMHLHQLIYKRIVRVHVGTRDPILKIRRNSKVALYIWLATCAGVLLAIPFWNNTKALIAIVIAFCVGYVLLYQTIAYRRITKWTSR